MRTLTEKDLAKITYVANSFCKKCSSLTKEDLINQGVVAFIENEHKFDSSTGKDIWDYMWLVIAGKVQDYIRRYDSTIYIPPTARDRGVDYQIEPLQSYNQSTTLVDKGQYFSQIENSMSFSDSVKSFLSVLNPRQRRIIAMRFGLDGYEPMSLEDVGNKIGLSRERVRQIEAKSLRLMRAHKPYRYVADLIGD